MGVCCMVYYVVCCMYCDEKKSWQRRRKMTEMYLIGKCWRNVPNIKKTMWGGSTRAWCRKKKETPGNQNQGLSWCDFELWKAWVKKRHGGSLPVNGSVNTTVGWPSGGVIGQIAKLWKKWCKNHDQSNATAESKVEGNGRNGFKRTAQAKIKKRPKEAKKNRRPKGYRWNRILIRSNQGTNSWVSNLREPAGRKDGTWVREQIYIHWESFWGYTKRV